VIRTDTQHPREGSPLSAGAYRKTALSVQDAQRLIESAPDAMVVVDSDGLIQFANLQAEALFGYPRKELLGKPVELLVPERFHRVHSSHRASYVANPDTRPMGAGLALSARRKDGSEFPVDISLSALKPKEGGLLVSAAVRDITERRRESAEERRMLDDMQRAMLNVLDDFSNEKMQGEVTHKALLNVLDDLSREKSRLEEAQKVVLNILKDLDLERSEVERVNIDLRAEVAERSQAEESLRARTSELARSNAELETFAHVASHDLQEPLRMMSSYTQLLAKRYHGQLDEDADEFIGFVVDGAKRMQVLIQDLLAFSRVGSAELQRQRTDCEQILEQALVNLEIPRNEAGATIRHEPLPTVEADSSQLLQVFQNLIDNAIKFRVDRPPVVEVGAERSAEGWRFFVRDNSIGIERAHVERIFSAFQRLHSREYPGTGIGLAICKKIVERHGGVIWVESEPGKGSTFFFTMPLEEPRAP